MILIYRVGICEVCVLQIDTHTHSHILPVHTESHLTFPCENDGKQVLTLTVRRSKALHPVYSSHDLFHTNDNTD
jgi:hypothetical protein